MTDTIADFLIRIKNAKMAGHQTVACPYSKMKEAISDVLIKRKFLKNKEITEKDGKKTLVLTFPEESLRETWEIKRISKPGRRVYLQAKDIAKAKRGTRLIIISSPQGIITGEQAIQKKQGGEFICKII